MIKRAAILLICLPILHQTLTLQVIAESVSVEINGNGSSSSNEVHVTSESNTTVNQNNEANITNNVTSNSNTGENSANNNTGGEVNIDTGNVNSTTNVSNQNINSNTADVDNCCNADSEFKIAGNGVNSTNVINSNNSSSVLLNQYNAANITNNVSVRANTGRNTANYNNGDVVIKTGNIKAETNILNKNINNNYANALSGVGGISAVISGNGAYSANIINVEEEKKFDTNNTNLFNLVNNVYQDLNTGGNEANGNLGDIAIVTGDIESVINIENSGNNNHAVSTCLCTPINPNPSVPDEPHQDSNNPGSSTVQSSNGNGNGGGNGGPGGAILPVTGGIPLTYLFTIILLLIFMLGLYLRFHSGTAPPAVARVI